MAILPKTDSQETARTATNEDTTEKLTQLLRSNLLQHQRERPLGDHATHATQTIRDNTALFTINRNNRSRRIHAPNNPIRHTNNNQRNRNSHR